MDYGVGNLLSVRRGLERCGARVTVTSDPEIILSAPRVVLPGVGAFANGMAELRHRGLDEAVRRVAESGTPLLGICLGMQMLMDESDEFGVTPGLSLIRGRVIQVPAVSVDGRAQKIPHIGWSGLIRPDGLPSWDRTILRSVRSGEAMYFVHSFMANPADARHRLADCSYGGVAVSAVIGRDDVVGCQFHPEKSGEAGLRVLRGWFAMDAREVVSTSRDAF